MLLTTELLYGNERAFKWRGLIMPRLELVIKTSSVIDVSELLNGVWRGRTVKMGFNSCVLI